MAWHEAAGHSHTTETTTPSYRAESVKYENGTTNHRKIEFFNMLLEIPDSSFNKFSRSRNSSHKMRKWNLALAQETYGARCPPLPDLINHSARKAVATAISRGEKTASSLWEELLGQGPFVSLATMSRELGPRP